MRNPTESILYRSRLNTCPIWQRTALRAIGLPRPMITIQVAFLLRPLNDLVGVNYEANRTGKPKQASYQRNWRSACWVDSTVL
jgi:hypothetical protein